VTEAVADTHALIFHAAGGGRPGPKARAAARALELPLITRDPSLQRSGTVQTLW
jgi:hypothetical protein